VKENSRENLSFIEDEREKENEVRRDVKIP
jgi:hypothetical protein